MYTHTCSCGEIYTDDDPDIYFCPSCVAQRKALAAEIDKKIASKPKKKVLSNYQILQEKGQTNGQATFVRASDLGIK